MRIYHIQSLSGHVRSGISNHDYKITGIKRFRMWSHDRRALSVIVSAEQIERHGRRRFIELKEGEVERVGEDIILNATHATQKGAILFWDLSEFVKNTNEDGKSSRLIKTGYPTSIETRKAEIVLNHYGRYCDTMLCVLYPGGMVKAIYGDSHVALEYENDLLKVDTGQRS